MNFPTLLNTLYRNYSKKIFLHKPELKCRESLRVQYPGAIYHIISRGNGGDNIFEDRRDYLMFLEELKEVIKGYNWISYAYCLMPDHYHLLHPDRDRGFPELALFDGE